MTRVRRERQQCRAPECVRAMVAKGLCSTHYKRERAGKPLTGVTPRAPRSTDHTPSPDGEWLGPMIDACPVCGAQWCHLPGLGRYRATTCSPECANTLAARTRSRRREGTAERDARIVAAAQLGRSRNDIATEHGITRARVGQIIRAHLRATGRAAGIAR